ncbi:MAG: transglutaminase TgpA family protein [Planctomycetota bacterium]
MNQPRRNPLLLFLTIGVGILVFLAASDYSTQATLALPVWFAAWFVSYGPGGVTMPRPAIILAVLGTTAYILLRIMVSPASELVLNISTYLLWLQVIKLYDRTESRDLSQLLVMSFALVVGACLLGSSLQFGFFLLVHSILGLCCAVTLQFNLGQDAPGAQSSTLRLGWLSGMPSRARRIALGLIVIVLVLASGLFVVLPRGMESEFYERYLEGDTLNVSFDDEVELGTSGLLSDSQQVVLDITLKDSDGQTVVEWESPIYLRGAVLDSYESGRWTTSPPPQGTNNPRLFTQSSRWRLRRIDDDHEVHVQQIELHNKSKNQIFSMPGAIGLHSFPPGRVTWNSLHQLFTMPDRNGRVSYSVVSQPDRPVRDPDGVARMERIFEGTRVHDEMLQLLSRWNIARNPDDRFAADDVRIAKFLEAHLRNRCAYTTELIAPEPNEDPIEMFLFRTQEGHCEYFASSMTAMLRSIGMDARVVTGYMVGEARLGGGSHVARENDAHAWVEVFHEPGIWTTYDPSPPNDVESLSRTPTGLSKLWSDLSDSVMGFWARSVIGYDQMRQQSMVGDWVVGFEERVRDLVLSSGRGLAFRPLRALASAVLYGVIASVAIGLLGFGSRLSLRTVKDWILMHLSATRSAGARASNISLSRASVLYRKAERALRRAGIDRPAWMTPMQFAHSLDERDASVATSMGTLASLHYKAVYSEARPSGDEASRAMDAFRSVQDRARDLRSRRRSKRNKD